MKVAVQTVTGSQRNIVGVRREFQPEAGDQMGRKHARELKQGGRDVRVQIIDRRVDFDGGLVRYLDVSPDSVDVQYLDGLLRRASMKS